MKFTAAQPRTDNQEDYLDAIEDNIVTICTGYAGTGKTFLSLNKAVELVLHSQKYRKILIIRPYMATNTGEKLGSLPGDINEKILPYVQGVRDNLLKMLPEHDVDKFIRNNMEFACLSLCRGRSFSDCVVIVDEAQNVPIDGGAMKMLLTRIGDNCKLVLQGDVDQCDIDPRDSALVECLDLLRGIKDLEIVEMNELVDIQRSKIVADVIKRYDG